MRRHRGDITRTRESVLLSWFVRYSVRWNSCSSSCSHDGRLPKSPSLGKLVPPLPMIIAESSVRHSAASTFSVSRFFRSCESGDSTFSLYWRNSSTVSSAAVTCACDDFSTDLVKSRIHWLPRGAASLASFCARTQMLSCSARSSILAMQLRVGFFWNTETRKNRATTVRFWELSQSHNECTSL